MRCNLKKAHNALRNNQVDIIEYSTSCLTEEQGGKGENFSVRVCGYNPPVYFRVKVVKQPARKDL